MPLLRLEAGSEMSESNGAVDIDELLAGFQCEGKKAYHVKFCFEYIKSRLHILGLENAKICRVVCL